MRRISNAFLMAVLLITLTATIPAQRIQTNALRVFAPVDISLRPNLAKRLKKFVYYSRAKRWSQLYDLTYKPDIHSENRRDFVKRERFVARGRGASQILGYVPQSTRTSPAGIQDSYEIEGCMKVRLKGRVHHWRGGVSAYLVSGNWYFTGIFSIVPATDMPPLPCSMSDGK